MQNGPRYNIDEESVECLKEKNNIQCRKPKSGIDLQAMLKISKNIWKTLIGQT